jgi:hypothetical protein
MGTSQEECRQLLEHASSQRLASYLEQQGVKQQSLTAAPQLTAVIALLIKPGPRSPKSDNLSRSIAFQHLSAMATTSLGGNMVCLVSEAAWCPQRGSSSWGQQLLSVL